MALFPCNLGSSGETSAVPLMFFQTEFNRFVVSNSITMTGENGYIDAHKVGNYTKLTFSSTNFSTFVAKGIKEDGTVATIASSPVSTINFGNYKEIVIHVNSGGGVSNTVTIS